MRKMRKNKLAAPALAVAVMAVLLFGGCRKAKSYGGEITSRQATPLKQILSDPNAYSGKTITIEGKITNVCPTGCWFNLKDENATIRIDLVPNGFAIPQNKGSGATVEGTVSVRDGQTEIIGKAVEIR